jgi:EspG family
VVTLSTDALVVVTDDLGIDLPYPLEAGRHAKTAAERADLRHAVEDELVEHDLLDNTGQVDPSLDRWLRVLARPELSIDSAFLPELGATPVRAVVARAGRTAVLATQRDDHRVRLRSVTPDRLTDVVVDLLPAGRRGTETSFSLPVDEVGHAEDRQALARLTASPRERGGQLAANGFSQLTGRRRSSVLSWFDNGSGRYFAQHRDGRDGRRWVTIAPADGASLKSRVGEMVASVMS